MKKASNTWLLIGWISAALYFAVLLTLAIVFTLNGAVNPVVFYVFAGLNLACGITTFFSWRKPSGGWLAATVVLGVLSLCVQCTVGAIMSKKAYKFILFKRKYLTIPYFLFLILFVIIPIIIIIVYAFTDTADDGSLVLSGAAFISFFTSTTKINVLVVSLFFGIMNTLICLLIGYPLSYLLADKKVNKNFVLVLLFIMPMWINFVLRTGATRDVLNFIGIQGGKHPYVATMIGMVYNYLPFTILPLYTTMLKLDKSQIEAARDLGANPLQTFGRNILPQSIPGIVSAAEMVLMPTMSSYVISDTLSEGKLTLFGNIIYLHFSQSMWNQGSFMALIMLVLIFITMFATKKFRGDDAPQRGAGLW